MIRTNQVFVPLGSQPIATTPNTYELKPAFSVLRTAYLS
jgi:hypothetical protein